MDARRASAIRPGLPSRGSFSAQMIPADASSVTELPLSDDDDAFEYLPGARHPSVARARAQAPSPSPPPPPPPSPPVLPFRSAQSVRVKSVARPSHSTTTSKANASRQGSARAPFLTESRARSASEAARSSLGGDTPSENRLKGSTALSSGLPTTTSSYEENDREGQASPRSAPSPSLIPVPSVHPIDTLSKKLRAQAEELTRVYEQLATQRERMASFKREAQAQKLEIERLKLIAKRQREEHASAASRRSTAASSRSTAPPCTVGVATRGTLSLKLKEAEQEKQRYEVAAKQLEQAVADAQCLFRERQVSSSKGDDDESESQTLEEQRTYIRVLEEVVHLKAREFQVSSHEELLVVLAELRHTIYEQEKKLAQHRELVRDAEARLLEEKQAHLQLREQFDRHQREYDALSSNAKAHESEMREQILSVQRELQQQNEQLQQTLAACAQLRDRERTLKRRVARESAESKAARDRLEQSVRSCDELKAKLEQASAQADDATRKAAHWEAEAARRQSHLDEMNALQEELLESIAEASAGQENASERVRQLEVELMGAKQSEKKTASKLEEMTAGADREKRQLKQRLEELRLLNEQVETECATLREHAQELDASVLTAKRQLQEHVERADAMQQRLDLCEKESSQRREAAALLEAALSAALQVAKASPSVVSFAGVEDGASPSVDASTGSEWMDTLAVEDMRACCIALDNLLTLGDEAASLWTDARLLSLQPLLERLVASGSTFLSEAERAAESWSRERRDLLDACAALDEANRMCRHEMDRRHHQLRDCQRALSDVQAMVIKSEALVDQYVHLQAVFNEKRVLEYRLTELQDALESGQSTAFALKNETCARRLELEALTAELHTAQEQLAQQAGELNKLDELRGRVEVLSRELDDSLKLNEEQNAWNEQLASRVERQEQAARRTAR